MQITLWLWFTVLFANFAEAMAESRGKAHAATLRKMRTGTVARRLRIRRRGKGRRLRPETRRHGCLRSRRNYPC